MASLILVRHPPVTLDWQRRCYGRSDPGLSRTGQAMVGSLVERLMTFAPDIILHSDMARTRAVAVPLARRLGTAALAAPLWRERDFGDWEGLSWQRIYRATGSAMDGMIAAPGMFRPGGNGETTSALIERIGHALEALPQRGRALVITHGGPIAAVSHHRDGTDIVAMAGFIVPPGSVIEFDSAPNIRQPL